MTRNNCIISFPIRVLLDGSVYTDKVRSRSILPASIPAVSGTLTVGPDPGLFNRGLKISQGFSLGVYLIKLPYLLTLCFRSYRPEQTV